MTRQFNIENLLKEQQKSLREFLGGHNIFVNLPTGFGKSLVSQCFPIVTDALFARLHDQVLWFGGMTGLHSFTYGVLKIPSLICASTNLCLKVSVALTRLVCFLVQFCPLFDEIFISGLLKVNRACITLKWRISHGIEKELST